MLDKQNKTKNGRKIKEKIKKQTSARGQMNFCFSPFRLSLFCLCCLLSLCEFVSQARPASQPDDSPVCGVIDTVDVVATAT